MKVVALSYKLQAKNMIKNYKKSNKPQPQLLPKQQTIDFILSYSKSTVVLKKDSLNFITFQN